MTWLLSSPPVWPSCVIGRAGSGKWACCSSWLSTTIVLNIIAMAWSAIVSPSSFALLLTIWWKITTIWPAAPLAATVSNTGGLFKWQCVWFIIRRVNDVGSMTIPAQDTIFGCEGTVLWAVVLEEEQKGEGEREWEYVYERERERERERTIRNVR